MAEAEGVAVVVVNGRVIRRNGSDALEGNERLPGRLLRGGKAA